MSVRHHTSVPALQGSISSQNPLFLTKSPHVYLWSTSLAARCEQSVATSLRLLYCETWRPSGCNWEKKTSWGGDDSPVGSANRAAGQQGRRWVRRWPGWNPSRRRAPRRKPSSVFATCRVHQRGKTHLIRGDVKRFVAMTQRWPTTQTRANMGVMVFHVVGFLYAEECCRSEEV